MQGPADRKIAICCVVDETIATGYVYMMYLVVDPHTRASGAHHGRQLAGRQYSGLHCRQFAINQLAGNFPKQFFPWPP